MSDPRRPSGSAESHLIDLDLGAARVAARSARARTVARWFGLTRSRVQRPHTPLVPDEQLDLLTPAARQILLITGPSGGGKSRLMRAVLTRCAATFIDLNAVVLPDRPLVDCFDESSTERVLSRLSRVGLCEAWSYVRTPSQLSEGQRWRLRLALAMGRADRQNLLVCDEFAAVLDRVTAAVVAHALRRTISASEDLRAIVVTSHDDLLKPLAPDLHVVCDFGSARLHRFTAADARSRSAPAPGKSPR